MSNDCFYGITESTHIPKTDLTYTITTTLDTLLNNLVYTTFGGHPEVSVTSRCVLRNSPSQTTMKYAPTCFLLIVSDNVWYHSYYSVSALFRWNFDADPNVVLLRAITCAMI